MVVGLYFVTFITAMTTTGMLLVRNRKVDTMVILFGFLVSVNSFGRYLLSISQTLETALWANRILYIGACFSPLVVIFAVARICYFKIPRIVSTAFVAYTAMVMILAMTGGVYPYYYKEVTLMHDPGGFSYLQKVYGPAHAFYIIMIALDFVLFLALIIYAACHKKNISVRTISMVNSIGLMIILTYALERIIHSHISYLTIGYLVSAIIMEKLAMNINKYDMPTNIASSVERIYECGYIEFDNDYRLIAYNDYARHIFPEVADWQVDKRIQPSDTLVYREVIEWVEHRKPEEKKTILVNDRYYEMYVRDIEYSRKKVGHMLEIVDRNAEYKYINAVKSYSEKLEQDVAGKTEKIAYIRDMMVLGMASMVESRDNSTGGHIKRTSAAMAVFVRRLKLHTEELGIDEDFLKMLVRAAPMHDLGKIAVDDAVLRKQGKYTPAEYNEMKKHSGKGYKIVVEILKGVEQEKFITLAANVAHYHHERWDGSGYPCGLKETKIPLEARVMALVDVFDALVSRRCYKEAYSFDKAFQIIRDSMGTHFDPRLGEIFMECRPQLEELYLQMEKEETRLFAMPLQA